MRINLRKDFYRKLLVLFSVTLFYASYSIAQTSSQYSFLESAGTYTAISGTPSTATGDDGVENGLPIGFSFVFGGSTYTTFSVSTNGFMKLGSTNIVTGTPNYTNTNFGTTTAASSNAPMIAGFWDDNGMASGSGGIIEYLTQGAPGSQTLTVQWTNCAFATGGTGANITFQIILYEGTNNIDIVYNGISATATGITATIGISSQLGDFLSVTPGPPATVSFTTANNSVDASSTSILTSGTTYTFMPPAACTTPPVGQTTASVSTICANTSFTLGVTGIPVASGYSYEFQSSPAGMNTFTSLAPAQSTPTYTVTTQTAATDYQVIVTCTNTSATATATLVSVAQTPFANCYCTPSSTCTNEGIVNVTMGTLNNTSAMCTTGGYQDFTGLGSQVSVTQGQQIAISVTDSINSNPSSAGVWIDYDQSGSFEASEFTFLGSTTVFGGTKMPFTFSGNITIPSGALTGVTRMRVRGANSSTPVAASGNYGPCNGTTVYGEYEDYLITINAGTPCSGTPAGGNVASSVSSMSCPTQFVLSATGFSSGVTGLSFQWQESMDNISFSNLGTATTDYDDDTIASISQTMYYRLEVTCTNGTGWVAYSDTVTVSFSPISTFPWLYDVETQNTTTNSNINADCWSSSPSNTTGAYRWDVDASGSTPSSLTGPNGAYSGSKYYYTEASNGSQGDSAKLMSPAIDITSLTVPQLAFYYHMYGSTMGNLIIQIDNGGGWISLDSIIGQQQTAMGDPWLLKTVDLTGYTGTIQIRLVGIRGSNFYGDMSIDNITVRETPTCPAPQSLNITNVTTTSADLDWVEMGSAVQWEIEYGQGNSFALGTGTREIANANPYSLGFVTPLTPSTQYTYFVRAICGPNDTSVWSGRSALFTTIASCDTPDNAYANNIMANSADLNWVDNNGASLWEVIYGPSPLSAATADTVAAAFYPFSLTSLLSGTTYEFSIRAVCIAGSDSSIAATGTFRTPPACGDNFYDSGGPTGVYTNYEDDTATIYPVNPGDQVTVTFSSFYTEGGYDFLYVYDGPDPSYPLLGTFDGQLTGSNLPGPFTSSDPSGALTFRFHSDVSGTYNGWEAAVTCAPPPTCLAPTSLSATNIMATSADLNWVDNSGASLWEVEYGPDPLTAGTGTVVYTTSNPYSIVSGLTPGTNYQFNVRTICSAGDTSGIASGYFATPPGCGGNFYDSGGSTGVYTNYEDDTTTIYPMNPGDQVTVTFNSFYTESGYDYLYVYDGPDVTYPLLGTFSGNLNSNLPGPFTSSDASGALTFRFHSDISGTYDGWAATVTCAPPPTCAIPSALGASNITTTAADLDWTENGFAVQWEIEYAQGNTFTTGNGTREIVNAKPYTLGSITPLMPSTQYSYFVRSICGANDTSAWSGRYTFNTALGNDLPAGAIPLTLGAGCSGLVYTNTGGTLSTGEPVISCRGTSLTSGMTVWFSFVAPQSGFVKISTDVSGSLDTKLGLFTTSNPTDPTDLASFSIIGCDDDNGVTAGASSIVYASDLAPGATYYIAVDHYNGTSAGNFCVMVDSVTTSMISPSGSCASSSNTTSLRQDYLAWVTLVDAQGRLIANTKRTTAGTSTVAAYTPSLTVNTSAVRDYNGQYYLDRNFAFTYGGTATGTTFDLKLYFLNTELTALNTVDANATLPNLNVTHATGSCASNFSNTGTISALLQSANGTDGSISWVNVNTPGFSNFYIMSGLDPLVIHLGDITATNIGASNRIEWNTLSEERSDKFELERSADGKHFAKIYERQANGEASRYTYLDNNPVKGYNYYRLRMTEANGKATYSEVVKAFVQSGGFEVEAYPNPVSHDLTVKVSGVQGADAAVQVTDVTGKVIQTIKMTGSVEMINMSGLANGIYLIKYSDANHTQTIRVNKQ